MDVVEFFAALPLQVPVPVTFPVEVRGVGSCCCCCCCCCRWSMMFNGATCFCESLCSSASDMLWVLLQLEADDEADEIDDEVDDGAEFELDDDDTRGFRTLFAGAGSETLRPWPVLMRIWAPGSGPRP